MRPLCVRCGKVEATEACEMCLECHRVACLDHRPKPPRSAVPGIPTEGRWFLTGTCGAVNLDATWRIRVEPGTDDWMVKADATHPGRGSVVLGRCASELDALAAIDAIHHGAADWHQATDAEWVP